MKRRIMQHLIWVFTACKGTRIGFPSMQMVNIHSDTNDDQLGKSGTIQEPSQAYGVCKARYT